MQTQRMSTVAKGRPCLACSKAQPSAQQVSASAMVSFLRQRYLQHMVSVLAPLQDEGLGH
ncbi:hypothetical protein APTSU1_000984900 [Apodemus speciosus]|uniref:Uncharacterized protein n=1 Tax=Apodemus speciosus TaxID=105296 RepID=A0ABQ0F689_APOSI